MLEKLIEKNEVCNVNSSFTFLIKTILLREFTYFYQGRGVSTFFDFGSYVSLNIIQQIGKTDVIIHS